MTMTPKLTLDPSPIDTALPTIGRNRDVVRKALHAAVERLDAETRTVVAYHLGWCDEVGNEIAANGGKAIRPGLTLLAAEAAGGGADCAVPGAVAVELVHNFSLVHDDLMDRDATRRHRPTVWALWGDATAVLAGDAMLSLAHEVLLESGSPHAIAAGRVVSAATRELIRGQAADVGFERRNDVTLTECLNMVAGKTASLLGASAAVGGILAGAATPVVEALESYGTNIGIAFQLIDDVLGIWGEQDVTGKPVFSDLRSRKKSLPVTWAVENGGPLGDALAEWLARPGDPTDAELREAADLVDSAGAREWAFAEAQRRMTLAEQALDAAAIGEEYRRELVDLAHFIVERNA
jgi:geranylgeranyl diphosphate synthase type I